MYIIIFTQSQVQEYLLLGHLMLRVVQIVNFFNPYNVPQRETNTMEYRYTLLCVILALQINFQRVKLHE
jgi:hypothetical protein